MKNIKQPKKLKEVQAQVQKVKEQMIPGASIPNSRPYKRANLAEAEAVLVIAKLQNRKVIRLPNGATGEMRKL